MVNSKRKCASCKERKRTDDGIVKGLLFYCDIECMVSYGMKNKHKPADKKHKAKKAALKANDKSLREKAAQASCNAFVRKRDAGLDCISCKGKVNFNSYIGGSGVNAGHYKSRGGSPALRFNEDNIHVQCFRCNVHLSGNPVPYRENLIDKIGLERVEWLEGPHEPKKYTCAELKEIELLYKQKLKDLLQ